MKTWQIHGHHSLWLIWRTRRKLSALFCSLRLLSPFTRVVSDWPAAICWAQSGILSVMFMWSSRVVLSDCIYSALQPLCDRNTFFVVSFFSSLLLLMILKPSLISAATHKVWTVCGQTVILEECVSFVCVCKVCVTVQVDSVGSDSFIVCVWVTVAACVCFRGLTPPGRTAECRRSHLLSFGCESTALSHSSLRREGESEWASVRETQRVRNFPNLSGARISLCRTCWLTTTLWDLARTYFTTAVDNARKG